MNKSVSDSDFKANPIRRQARAAVEAKFVPSYADVASRSRFLRELVKARVDAVRSVANVARMANVTPAAVRKMEKGKGPVTTLIAVMQALPFQVVGVAKGRTFAEQLRNRREKIGLSIDAVAAKAVLSSREVVELEEGGGTMQSLLRLLAAIAPQARRSAPERSYWAAGDKIDRDSRFSPTSFMEPIYDVFGEVDLDPCAHPDSPVRARRSFTLTDGRNGLVERWSGRVVWVNPPYSEYKDWLLKVHEEWLRGDVGTLICLVPVRTDGAYFHKDVEPEADLYFIRGRVKFINLKGKAVSTPYSLMLVIYGATAEQKLRLAQRVPGFWHHRNSSSYWPPYRDGSGRRWTLPDREDRRSCEYRWVAAGSGSCSSLSGAARSVTCRPVAAPS